MKMLFLFNTLLTQKGSSNSEMYGSWDSECNGFPRTVWWIVESCVKRETCTNKKSRIYFVQLGKNLNEHV